MSVYETPIKCTKTYKLFTYAMKFLANSEERNDYILRHLMHDLKANPKVSIVIPLVFRNHVLTMVRNINQEYGELVAEAFLGGGGDKVKREREEILNRARQGKTRVIVGIRKLLQLGIDCPAWNLLYEVMPISNKPMLYQETSRIRTPDPAYPAKRPRIKFFVDVEMGQSLGCFRSTAGHLRDHQFADYHWTEASAKRLSSIMKGGGRYYGKDVDYSTKEGYDQLARNSQQPLLPRSSSQGSLFDTKARNRGDDGSNTAIDDGTGVDNSRFARRKRL
jgi:hypothetical protein